MAEDKTNEWRDPTPSSSSTSLMSGASVTPPPKKQRTEVDYDPTYEPGADEAHSHDFEVYATRWLSNMYKDAIESLKARHSCEQLPIVPRQLEFRDKDAVR